MNERRCKSVHIRTLATAKPLGTTLSLQLVRAVKASVDVKVGAGGIATNSAKTDRLGHWKCPAQTAVHIFTTYRTFESFFSRTLTCRGCLVVARVLKSELNTKQE
jgi:hypothetical protein